MSRGAASSPWDPEPGGDDPHGEHERLGSAAIHPSARADSVVATWGLLILGHVVEACFGVWALGWGGLQRRYDDPAPAITAVVVITILGWTGTAVTWRMLRTALDARQALDHGRPPARGWPPPIVLTSLFVLFAVVAGVVAVFGWQAVGVFPAVAIELMQIPLALRTERLLRDADAGAGPTSGAGPTPAPRPG